MAIKFIPENISVKLEGREVQDKLVLSALNRIIARLDRLEMQLEFITDEAVDTDNGDRLT